MPKNKNLKFKAYSKQQRVPFAIYADTEAYLIPQNHFDTNNQTKEPFKEQQDNMELNHLHEFFNYSRIDDTDLNLNINMFHKNNINEDDEDDDDDDDDNDDNDDDDVNISTADAKNNSTEKHPWSSKKLKITTKEDIDATLKKIDEKSGVINKHRMASYAVTVACPPILSSHFESVYIYRGEQAEEKFVQLLIELQHKIEDLREKEGQKKMRPLTYEQLKQFHSTNKCHICTRPITYEGTMETWTKQRDEINKEIPSIKLPDGTVTYKPQLRPHFKSDTDELGPGKNNILLNRKE